MSAIKKINVNGTEYDIGGQDSAKIHYLFYDGSKLTENDVEKTHSDVMSIIETMSEIVLICAISSDGTDDTIFYSLSGISTTDSPIYFESADKDSNVNVLKLNTNSTVEITSKSFITLKDISDKADKPSQITSGENITLADNAEYRLTNVSNLTIEYPETNFECWLRIATVADGTVTITLPTSSYIGDTPTFANGETWELSIKDGVVIASKVTV